MSAGAGWVSLETWQDEHDRWLKLRDTLGIVKRIAKAEALGQITLGKESRFALDVLAVIERGTA